MLLQLLFLSLSPFLFQFVASQGYTCSENTVVTPPLDITKPYYYPNDWNESMPPAKYNPSQNCNWKINILEGMYATVTFYKNSNYTGSFTAWYSNNNVVG
ncbi:hypothetical protein CRE_16041 [Caenorhabditis remanei]|nr:hypothetical protein CRE_16041 [Caenorhabditis remanei]